MESENWIEKSHDSWSVFKIMGELVEGYEKLSQLGPCVSIFGSARTKPDNKFYKETVEISEFCSLSQLRTPIGLLENLPSSFINPFIPLTQSQQTNLFIFSLSQEKLTSFSNLSSSLVLIQINEVLDFISNSKFLHQEFIM